MATSIFPLTDEVCEARKQHALRKWAWNIENDHLELDEWEEARPPEFEHCQYCEDAHFNKKQFKCIDYNGDKCPLWSEMKGNMADENCCDSHYAKWRNALDKDPDSEVRRAEATLVRQYIEDYG
jgi:hypothetical protein